MSAARLHEERNNFTNERRIMCTYVVHQVHRVYFLDKEYDFTSALARGTRPILANSAGKIQEDVSRYDFSNACANNLSLEFVNCDTSRINSWRFLFLSSFKTVRSRRSFSNNDSRRIPFWFQATCRQILENPRARLSKFEASLFCVSINSSSNAILIRNIEKKKKKKEEKETRARLSF